VHKLEIYLQSFCRNKRVSNIDHYVDILYSETLLQRLLTTGVVFESLPTSLSLPPESGPHPVILPGTPTEIGELEVLGK
jgi:hypothetical protein